MAGNDCTTVRLLGCSKCKELKPEDDFYVRACRKRGRHYQCKACSLAAQKTPHRRALANKATAEFRARLREQDYEEFRRREREGNLRRQYGFGQEQYDALVAAQKGLCAICGEPPRKGRGRKLHVDHDHTTGQVRALLCGNCNMGLGAFAEDPVRLQAAIRYLESFTVTVPIS